MRPSPSITGAGQGRAGSGSGEPAPLRAGTPAKGTRGRGGRTGAPAPQRLEASPRHIKGKVDRDILFHGQVREEGLEKLPEPRQQRSWALSSPSHPANPRLPPGQSEDIKKKAPNRIDTPPPP